MTPAPTACDILGLEECTKGGTLPERLRHRVRRTPSHQRKAGSRERARRLSLPRRPGVPWPATRGASAPGGHPESRRAVGVRSGSGSERAAETTRSVPSSREYDMTANTKLIGAIAGALVAGRGEAATEWLDGGGRANVERIVADWGAAIEEGRWIERLEDVLVLRALHLETHWVEVLGGPDAEALVREFVDEDWRTRGVETATQIGEVFVHALLPGDTGEPFESIEYAFREHGDANPRRGRRAAVERGDAALGRRDQGRGVPCRGALRRAPGAVRRPAGKRAPGEGGGGRGRRERMDPGRGRSSVPVPAGPARGRGGADHPVRSSAFARSTPPISCSPPALGGARREGTARPARRDRLEGGRERAGERVVAGRDRR